MSTVLFSGGGTGGHLFPGIAVAESLRELEPGARCVFVGSQREIERRITGEYGLEHHTLPVEPSTGLTRNPVRFAWRYWRSRRHARRLIDELRPGAVVGLGGFASVPVVSAATAANVPSILLEQNAVPGRATRWLAKRAALVCLSFGESAGSLPRGTRIYETGNPVRKSVAALHGGDGPARSSVGPARAPTLLVLGGSQGAAALNEAVPRAIKSLPQLAKNWRIMHQTGPANVESVRSSYRDGGIDAEVAPFFADLPARLSVATMAVARAGGTTLAELACAGCPAILVPFPGAIADHQLLNGRAYEKRGAARVIEQAATAAATADRLAEALGTVVGDRSELARMSGNMRTMARPGAARAVAEAVLRHAIR